MPLTDAAMVSKPEDVARDLETGSPGARLKSLKILRNEVSENAQKPLNEGAMPVYHAALVLTSGSGRVSTRRLSETRPARWLT